MRRILLLLLLVLLGLSPLCATPKIALVLSGGGARGLAHIVVLEALEEQGIPIDLVLGTSMGSLVGGLYSAGYTPKEIRSLLEDADLVGLFAEPVLDTKRKQDNVFAYTHNQAFSLGFGDTGIGNAPAFIGDQRILELLGYLFSRHPAPVDFDALPIPFRCVSADAMTKERIVHDSGSLVGAIRSSISIPIVFTPYPYKDGRLVVDGGVVDNLPIDLARSLGADIVIACDVNEMQVQEYTNLESLSAMTMQTIILVTQDTAKRQHSQADLVFFPKLQEIYALDFSKYEEILALGREAVEEKAAELSELTDRIAQERGLVVLDPDRPGPYSLLPNPMILQLEVRDISLNPGHSLVEESMFSRFLGRRLDKQTATELNLRMRELRKAHALATVSYEMADDGVLLVQTRGFGTRSANISMGFQMDAGFSNALPSSSAWYRSDVFLDASLAQIGDSDFTFLIQASLGQKTGLGAGLSHPFAVNALGTWDVHLSLAYASGSMSTHNALVDAQRSAPLDRAFRATLGLDVYIGEYTHLKLDGWYDLIGLHDSRYPKQFLAFPQLELSLLSTTLDSRFSSHGYRLDVLVRSGYLKEPLYAFRLAWEQKFALTYADSLGYDLQVSMLREPYALLSSYADMGFPFGVPGYSPLSLRRDLAMAGSSWTHRLTEVLGYPAFCKVNVRLALFDAYDPYLGVEASSDELFSPTQWDLGLGISLALDTPLGEVLVSLGTSIGGKVTFLVGAY